MTIFVKPFLKCVLNVAMKHNNEKLQWKAVVMDRSTSSFAITQVDNSTKETTEAAAVSLWRQESS